MYICPLETANNTEQQTVTTCHVSVTRGNSLKLLNQSFHYDLRKYSFPARVVNTWNSLSNVVVLASSLDTYKNRLDRFWGNQDVKYDYTAELT